MKSFNKGFLTQLNEKNFNEVALEIFKMQYQNCEVYRIFCNYLNKKPKNVTVIEDIPFLPIQFFKTKKIVSNPNPVKKIFESSGTSGAKTSKHYVTDLELYKENSIKIFEQCYGSVKDYAIIALLPSYLEREGSSLVYMVDHFIKKSRIKESGFFLDNLTSLFNTLKKLESRKQKTLLIGVSFGLLDFTENFKIDLKQSIVMETGGMKGRRKEMVREELHNILKKGFGVEKIHSEYGMTELLSQCYSKGDGIFDIPDTMKILLREAEDPLSIIKGFKKTGGINVIDLANVNSCAFIATQDLGQKLSENQIKILGRFDDSDIRGCNLMIQSLHKS